MQLKIPCCVVDATTLTILFVESMADHMEISVWRLAGTIIHLLITLN